MDAKRTSPNAAAASNGAHGGNGAAAPSFTRLRDQGREMVEEAGAFADAAGGAAGEARELAREQLTTRPYWVLGAAFAVGWVLGGGVPPRAARMAADVATRAATHALASRVAAAVAGVGAPPEGDPSGSSASE